MKGATRWQPSIFLQPLWSWPLPDIHKLAASSYSQHLQNCAYFSFWKSQSTVASVKMRGRPGPIEFLRGSSFHDFGNGSFGKRRRRGTAGVAAVGSVGSQHV